MKTYRTLKNFTLYIIFFLLFQTSIYSQENYKIYFQQEEIDFEKGRIVSNSLVIKNISSDSTVVSIHVLAPEFWKIIGANKRSISVLPNDSVLVPLRYFPMKTKSGTDYLVQVYTSSNNNSSASTSEARFSAKIKSSRIKNVSLDGARVVYLKNNEDIGAYTINVDNRSNEIENISSVINYYKLSSADTISQYSNFNLSELQDTVISGNVKILTNDEFRRRDEDNLYLVDNYAKRGTMAYSIFDENNRLIDMQNLQFISLPNTYINEVGGDAMPMIIDARWNSYLDSYSSMNVSVRGNKLFENNHRFTYNWNTTFSTNSFSSSPYKYSSGYLAYYTPRWYAQAGNIGDSSFGVNIGGWGARGGYFITKNNHQLQFYYIQSPYMFGSVTRRQTGINYTAKISIFDEVKIGYFYRKDLYFNDNFHGANLGFKLPISSKHKTSLSMSATQNTTTHKVGLFGVFGYNGLIIKDRLGVGLSVMYRDRYYAEGNNSAFRALTRLSYSINKKAQILLTSNYTQQTRYYQNSAPYEYSSITSNLDFRNKYFSYGFTPGVFFKKYIQLENNYNQYGIRLRFNEYYPDKYMRYALTFQGGYNQSYVPEIDNPYFFFQMFGLVRYKTLSFNAMYSLGNVNNFSYNRYTTIGVPQSLRLSLSNQYNFKNKHYLLNINSYYKYEVHFKSHSLGIQPQLYYYTNSRWRFGVEMMYNYRSRMDISNIDYSNTDNSFNTDMDFTFGLNVRKQIDIPLPWLKNTYEDVVVEAFYDTNGNRVRDKEEKVISNAVVQLDDFEAITDERGVANFVNIKTGNYKLKVTPLELVKGWYEESSSVVTISDNYMAIPFLKGKSIRGSIILEKEKYSSTVKEDFSNILITSTDEFGNIYETISEYNGNFEFYLPTGNYSLSMDETIFSSKYKVINNNPIIEVKRDTRTINYVFIISEKQRKVNVKKF